MAKSPKAAGNDQPKSAVEQAQDTIRARDAGTDIADDAADTRTDATDLPAATARQRKDDDEDGERRPVAKTRGDEAREAIAAKAKRLRRGEPTDEDEDEAAEREDDEAAASEARAKLKAKDDDEDDAEGDRPTVRSPGAKKPAKAAAKDDDNDDEVTEMVTLTVNGRKVQLPRDEVERIAATNLAADQRLEDAKRQAREIVAKAKTATTQPGGRGADDEDDEAHQPPRSDDRRQPGRKKGQNAIAPESLLNEVDQIQSGTREEGAAALARAIEQGIAVALDQQRDTQSVVSDVIDQRDSHAEINRAMAAVVEKFPEVNADNVLALKAVEGGFQGIRNELQTVMGYSDEDFEGLTPGDVLNNYVRIRRMPQYASQLRPLEEILTSAAQPIHDRYIKPFISQDDTPRPGKQGKQPGRIILDRTARQERRAGLISQPRPAGTRADLSSTERPSLQERRRDAVQKMREARGRPALVG